MDVMYRNDNPDLPSLEPWILKTRPPSERIVFERNPYYYRVDGAGHQLPYLDRVVFSIASSKIIPAKTGAGERSEEHTSELQSRFDLVCRLLLEKKTHSRSRRPSSRRKIATTVAGTPKARYSRLLRSMPSVSTVSSTGSTIAPPSVYPQ